MSNEGWFSTKLRFVILVEATGGDTLYEGVFLLRAPDFAEAFDRALSIGRGSQKEYRNDAGQWVQWRFMEVVSLDVIHVMADVTVCIEWGNDSRLPARESLVSGVEVCGAGNVGLLEILSRTMPEFMTLWRKSPVS